MALFADGGIFLISADQAWINMEFYNFSWSGILVTTWHFYHFCWSDILIIDHPQYLADSPACATCASLTSKPNGTKAESDAFPTDGKLSFVFALGNCPSLALTIWNVGKMSLIFSLLLLSELAFRGVIVALVAEPPPSNGSKRDEFRSGAPKPVGTRPSEASTAQPMPP